MPLQVQPYLSASTLMLLQPTAASSLGDNPILQEVQEDGSLSVLAENDGSQEAPPRAGRTHWFSPGGDFGPFNPGC